jgi:phytoene synthase
MDLDAAYRSCEEVVREHAGNFRYSFPFLPKPKKRAICAVYAFSRRADDIVDEKGDDKERRLDELRGALREEPREPVFVALADAVRRYSIPLSHFEGLIDGMKQDLSVTRYETFEDLRRYCYLAASTVGLICLEIFTYSDPAARERGIDLGVAMQLTNIVRDVGEDAARGRIYLPGEECRRFGVAEDDILAGRASEASRELIRLQVGRARELFKRSEELLRFLPRHARSCPKILAGLYGDILTRIERAGYDVFDGRASLSGPRKAWIAFTGLVGSLV